MHLPIEPGWYELTEEVKVWNPDRRFKSWDMAESIPAGTKFRVVIEHPVDNVNIATISPVSASVSRGRSVGDRKSRLAAFDLAATIIPKLKRLPVTLNEVLDRTGGSGAGIVRDLLEQGDVTLDRLDELTRDRVR